MARPPSRHSPIPTDYEMMIMDAGPRARAETRTIVEASHLIVLPTGVAADDREPMLELIEDIKANRHPAGAHGGRDVPE